MGAKLCKVDIYNRFAQGKLCTNSIFHPVIYILRSGPSSLYHIIAIQCLVSGGDLCTALRSPLLCLEDPPGCSSLYSFHDDVKVELRSYLCSVITMNVCRTSRSVSKGHLFRSNPSIMFAFDVICPICILRLRLQVTVTPRSTCRVQRW